MGAAIAKDIAEQHRMRLEDHPVYEAVTDLDDLRCFMEHHVYSVWDFMSLIKYLQSIVAPTTYPWTPGSDASIQRFINELVLEEESDEHPVDGGFSSHFELYLRGMEEIGADTAPIREFVSVAKTFGIDAAFNSRIPAPSKVFTRQTFDFIVSGKPHIAAAALALGREHIIPGMFRSILAKTGVTAEQAPVFHAYLERHIHLDEDFHAPLSLRLLDHLCAGNQALHKEAAAAAETAVAVRMELWDGVLEAIQTRRPVNS